MKHRIGRLVANGTRIGPDSGKPVTSPGVWEFAFTPLFLVNAAAVPSIAEFVHVS